MRFRLVPTAITLDDLERLKHHSCRNKQNLWAHQKHFNEDKLILSAAKCRPMIAVSKNIRYMRDVTVYLRPNCMCLCEIIPSVLLTYRVAVHWGVGRVCPRLQRALTAPDCIVHRECLSRAVTHVCVLRAILYAFCLLLPLGYVGGE